MTMIDQTVTDAAAFADALFVTAGVTATAGATARADATVAPAVASAPASASRSAPSLRPEIHRATATGEPLIVGPPPREADPGKDESTLDAPGVARVDDQAPRVLEGAATTSEYSFGDEGGSCPNSDQQPTG